MSNSDRKLNTKNMSVDNMSKDQESECGTNLLTNNMNGAPKKIQNRDPAMYREMRRMLRFYALVSVAVVAIAFLILTITFSILYANLKYDIAHHSHPPKVGAQMSKILEKEELCLVCDDVRLGPSPEEDSSLNNFVRKYVPGEKAEKCCVETPAQLLELLQLFVKRKYREEMAYGNIKVETSSKSDNTVDKPAAHLMGSVRQISQPYVAGKLFPIDQWIYDEDLAFTNKVQYRHGRIAILEAGFYYVYSQLSFLEVFDSGVPVDRGAQSLSHYIYRYNIVYPAGGEESMIQNSITKCWGANKAFGEYTSYLGAVFYLRRGDELFVKASNLTLIVREPKQNYFGVYKVN